MIGASPRCCMPTGRQRVAAAAHGEWLAQSHHHRGRDRQAQPDSRVERDGQLLDQAWRPSRYDPRLRPWFVGAMMQGEDHETFWTTPYRFLPPATRDQRLGAVDHGGRQDPHPRLRHAAGRPLGADQPARSGAQRRRRGPTDEGGVLGLPRHTNFRTRWRFAKRC